MNLHRIRSKNLIFMLFLIIKIGIKKILNLSTTYSVRSSIGICGKNLIVNFPSHIRNYDKIEIGNGVFFADNVFLDSELSETAFLKVMDCVKLNNGVKIDFSGGVVIGKGTTISESVLILTHSHGYNPRSEPVPKPLKVGSNVWIGSRATITENVSCIGDNSIIATGSIVTKDVEPNSIYAGVPAKKIKEKNENTSGSNKYSL